jgi:hypothetical protein
MHTVPNRFATAWALLAMMVLGFIPHMSEAAWKIRQFEVFAGAPYQRADGVVDAIGVDWAEAEDYFPGFERAEVEKAFNAAAAWYSEKGFPEPLLEPIVETENGPAYRVYVCSEALKASKIFYNVVENVKGAAGFDRDASHWASCEHWGAYNGACARSQGARPTFYLNANGPAFKNGRLTVEGRQTVTHELFHAIQANTVMGRSPQPCKQGDWILEGMADAVSMDVLEYLWPGIPEPKNDGWITKKFGVRAYYETLALDRSGYPVSSFWRFLGDLNRGYDFLFTGRDGTPGVFDFEIHGAGKWQSEVSWLDAGLYTKFNMRLNELLGLFMNDYAMRVAPLSWTSGHAEQDLPRWVKGVLGECEEITLSDRKPSQVFFRDIAPVAGGCAWLTVNVAQSTAQVSLQAETDDLAVFKDIWVGLAAGNTVLSDAMIAGPSPSDPSKSIGIWHNFTVHSGFPVLLTFTNAADDPEKSKQHAVTFDISMPSSTNSLRGNAPAGPGKAAPPAQKPSYQKHTQTLQKKTAATGRMITEQKRLDKETLSPHATLSTSVALRPEVPPCSEAFKYTPCGPYTSISMNLVPGTYLDLALSSGTGGLTSQVFSSLMGQAMSNPFDAGDVMAELGEKLESIDASSVSIMMPFIDYGFTGSIDNAMISTKVGGIQMQSVGPLDGTYQSPLVGSVSIEEYTPMRIRGSFTAPLAWFEPAPAPDQPPVFKSGPILTGTFNQVAPWLEDSRVGRIQLQSEREMADDVGKALGVPAATMRSLRQQGVIPGGESPGTPSSGGGGSGAAVGGGCDCDCANKGTVDELCEFFCEEEFAACPD